jgi:hypothetical protein
MRETQHMRELRLAISPHNPPDKNAWLEEQYEDERETAERVTRQERELAAAERSIRRRNAA